MSRVFIPQIPSRFDPGLGQWVPTVSVDSAKKFGDIVIMLPPEAGRLKPENIVQQLRFTMADYDKDDFLLAMGEPSIIAIAAILADQAVTPLRLLRWDKRSREYTVVTLDVEDKGAGR